MEPSHTRTYTDFQIEKEVISLLDKTFPQGLELPIDIDLVAEKNELADIMAMSCLTSKFSTPAVLLVNGVGKYNIMVDADTDAFNRPRANFSVAHEVGHLVLHKNLYTSCRTIEDSINLSRRIERSYGRIEREANFFAGAILIPRKTIFEDTQKVYEAIMKGMSPDIEEIQDVKPRLVSTLARRYMVSVEAMKIRLKQLNINREIDKATANRLDFIFWD